MSNPKYAATLQELRQQRGLLDQAIVALELLNGERPMPEVTHVLVEPARPPKLLAAARRVRVKRKYSKRTAAVSEKPVTAAAVTPKVDGRRSVDARRQDDLAVAALQQGQMTPDALRTKLGIDETAARALFARLKRDGRMVVIGAGRGTRYALPKEAP